MCVFVSCACRLGRPPALTIPIILLPMTWTPVHWWQQSVYYIRPAAAGGGRRVGAVGKGKDVTRYSDRFKRQQEEAAAAAAGWVVMHMVEWMDAFVWCASPIIPPPPPHLTQTHM